MEDTININQEEAKESKPNKEPITISNISSQIDYLLSLENNKDLETIQRDLNNYKAEIEASINSNTPIKHSRFKNVLFSNVEKLLYEIIYYPFSKIRNEKIRQICKWYKTKLRQFNSLDRISIQTQPKVNQIFLKEEMPNDDILIQDDQYEYQEFKKHRSEIEDLDLPKDRLKTFKKKKLNPPQSMKKDSKVLANLRFNLERFKGRVGSGKSSITIQSTHYATRTGKKWFSNSGIGVNDNLKPIEPKKEVKNSYSHARPDYNYNRLVIENTILKEKNKELRNKRSQEEIKNYITEFGRTRAFFKEEREMKYSYSNLIENYDKILKLKPFSSSTSSKELISKDEKVGIDKQKENNNNEHDKTPKGSTVLYSKIQGTSSITHRNKDSTNSDFKVFTSLNKEDLMKSMINAQKDMNGVISSDTFQMAMTHDNILSTRKRASKLCNVNEVNNPKTGYRHHYTPLSAFDAVNYDSQFLKSTREIKCRPNTVAQYISDNYKEYQYDLLSLKKTMDKFNLNELDSIEKTLTKAESCSQIDEIKKRFEPIKHPQYSLAFLPRTKSSLLPMPSCLIFKKAKKTSPKKKH